MPGSKAHQQFGLCLYVPYALFTVAALGPAAVGVSGASVVCLSIGAALPDILDPPTGWRHRAKAHSTTRCGWMLMYTAAGSILSCVHVAAIPFTAFCIGYLSHLLADSTTPAGLPEGGRKKKNHQPSFPDITVTCSGIDKSDPIWAINKKYMIHSCKKRYDECRSYLLPTAWSRFEGVLQQLQSRHDGLFVFFTRDRGKSRSMAFPGTRVGRGTVTFVISDVDDIELVQYYVWNARDDITPLRIRNEQELVDICRKHRAPYVMHRVFV